MENEKSRCCKCNKEVGFKYVTKKGTTEFGLLSFDVREQLAGLGLGIVEPTRPEDWDIYCFNCFEKHIPEFRSKKLQSFLNLLHAVKEASNNIINEMLDVRCNDCGAKSTEPAINCKGEKYYWACIHGDWDRTVVYYHPEPGYPGISEERTVCSVCFKENHSKLFTAEGGDSNG